MTTAVGDRLHCVHFLPSIRLAEGGVARAVMDLCAVLARRGRVAVTLLTCDATDVPAEWMQSSVGAAVPRVIVLPRWGRLGLLGRDAMRQAETIIRESHVLHLHAPWLTSNAQLARAGRRANIPYILSVHGMLDDWSMAQRQLKKRLYLTLSGNRLLRGAARIHCTARGELEQAGKWFPREKGIVLPLVFDLEPYRQLPGTEPAQRAFGTALAGDRPKVLFLSRLHPKKGVELLIEAVAMLKSRGAECDVLIAGSGEAGYESSLRQLARSRGIEQSVHFLGLVGGVEKVSLYQAADLFVLPTSQENFGLVFPEALACETPVITTRGVDIWSELEQAGARIVERSANTIADAIGSMLADRAALVELGQRGRAWVFDYLDPDRIANEYEKLYAAV